MSWNLIALIVFFILVIIFISLLIFVIINEDTQAYFPLACCSVICFVYGLGFTKRYFNESRDISKIDHEIKTVTRKKLPQQKYSYKIKRVYPMETIIETPQEDSLL